MRGENRPGILLTFLVTCSTAFVRMHYYGGTDMNTSTKRVLFWTPRVLCILFAMFLSLFALDVFDESQGLGKTILALLIHLIPVYIVVIVLVIAWRWELVGAILFKAFAVLYVVLAWGRFHWSTYLVISGPLVVVGILFLFNWIYRTQLRTR